MEIRLATRKNDIIVVNNRHPWVGKVNWIGIDLGVKEVIEDSDGVLLVMKTPQDAERAMAGFALASVKSIPFSSVELVGAETENGPVYYGSVCET